MLAIGKTFLNEHLYVPEFFLISTVNRNEMTSDELGEKFAKALTEIFGRMND